MKKLIFLCFLFVSPCACETGSHSLWMMATYIRGNTPFPEFSGYLMLDDIAFVHYDSYEAKVMHIDSHSASDTVVDADLLDYIGPYLGYVHVQLKDRASYLKNHFNHTNDISVFQRAAGCELLDDGKPGPMVNKDAYNGEVVEVEYYDVDHDTLHTDRRLPNMNSYIWTHFSPSRYGMIYDPNCIKHLKKHLAKERMRVLKKVKPRIRLLQKTLPDSGGAKVTCLATGFYPRHINLTLLRDGQPVPDHQITGGELLPNVDGTYQMRKSLEVSAEELREKHQYTCTAEHLSLDNKLDIGLGYEPGEALVPIGASLLVVFVVGGIAGSLLWKRRHRGNKTSSLSSYRATSKYKPGEALVPIPASLLVLLVVVVVGGIAGLLLWKRKHRGDNTTRSSSYRATSSTEEEETSMGNTS